MKEYHKIQSIFVRNESSFKFIHGNFKCPEFQYLAFNEWIGTEKVDGTNIRVIWTGEDVKFQGKTDRAQIPSFLLERLEEMFRPQIATFADVFGDWNSNKGEMPNVCLYGEGYGAKIQKGGGNYISNGVDFVLFDVRVGQWWLRRKDIEIVTHQFNIRIVPIIYKGSIWSAIDLVRNGFKSEWGDFPAEGLVLKPEVELFSRKGNRIITKMKTKDFEIE